MSTNDPVRTGSDGRGEKPVRVLLIAYQCAPEGGSVSMIGWRWYRYLKRVASVHLVTHVRNRAALAPLLEDGDEVSYVDTEAFAGPLYRLGSKWFGRSQHVLFMFASLDFIYFCHKLMRTWRKSHKLMGFNLCHAPTPVSAAAPHRLGRLGLPTILGPLNSGLPAVRGFPDILKAERAWLYRFRFLGRWLTSLWGTFRHADLIFSATAATDRALGPKWHMKTRRLCENGVDDVADSVPPFPTEARLVLLFAGRLVPIKGVSLLLDALARVEQKDVVLRIAGDGPMRDLLERQIERLGLTPRVELLGHRPSQELPALYRGCHLHVLPSIRESGGATILEAMAQGRPSAALDFGGPAETISPNTGFLIARENSEQVIGDLADLIRNLHRDPSVLERMAVRCLQKARDLYTWHAKVEAALQAYRDVTGRGVAR